MIAEHYMLMGGDIMSIALFFFEYVIFKCACISIAELLYHNGVMVKYVVLGLTQ